MQSNPHQEPNHNINNFINNVLTDLKNLTNLLRPISKSSAQVNNALINKLLLGNDRDSLQLAKDILSHLLHIVDMKGINTSILTILAKVIAFIKILEETESKGQNRVFEVQLYSQYMNTILYHIIDIIFLLKNKHKDTDMALRIIQTAFSLIDSKILQFANENLFIRIYSICFQCCLSSPIIQNISISALFALTQIIFSSEKNDSSLSILNHFLEFVFNSKRFTWLKQMQFKGIVWDLIIVSIRNFPLNQMLKLRDHKSVFVLLNIMYKTSIQKVFVNTEETKSPRGKDKAKKNENQKSINFKKGSFTDFIRYYKSFIYLSIHLSIRCHLICGEIVPFRQSLHLFKIANELQRGTKLYILLEGISLLITEGHSILIEDDKGIIILDVVCKIIEELCLSAVVIDLSAEVKDFYLEKMCGDFSKISDSDHARIIKNLIIKLRKNFEKNEQQKAGEGEIQSARSQLSERSQLDANFPKPLSEKKKWQRLIRTIISIIRYLTSLNMNEFANQQIVRKLIIQFQYWFLICPSFKTKNLILQELYNTSTLMDNKLQSIKVSQCVQLGSNIIYGYYDTLDSLGLTMIIRMMAGVKVSWEEGKGFEELDQVCSMSEKLYSEQRLVHNEKSFVKTIQALVQSANSILADFQMPQRNEEKGRKIGKNPQDKSIKLIDYIFSKMKIILEQNLCFISQQWNFLTGFWISFCSNKNPQIRLKAMNHIGSINPTLLKTSEIDQQLILSTYIQLSKLHIQEIPKLIIQHLKQFLSNISNEEAILQIFHIIRLLTENKDNKILFEQVYQLQEMIVKESIFKIKTVEKLMSIIDSITVLNSDKNQQYKIVNLIWSIFDHVKVISTNKEVKQSEVLWKKIFNKIYLIAFHSVYGETKQSCIHVFTQVLAESTHIIDQQLLTNILEQNYIPLFIVLIGINQKAAKVENISQAQTMKVAIKNLSKIIKKCIGEKNIAFTSLIQVINVKLLNFFNGHCQPSIQFLFELCSYFQLLKSLRQNESSLSQMDVGKISELLKVIQTKHGPLDKASVFWRKKYEPVFTPLQAYFSKN